MKRLIGWHGVLWLCLVIMLLCGCKKETDSDPVKVVAALEASMVYVDGGSFSMGATEEQGDEVWHSEKPVHEVTLDGFYIGQYEVTQAQWAAVMGKTLSDMIAENDWSAYGIGDNYPMYNVSWHDAVAFCEKLSEMTGKTYRLPTEAEWEYAARGGRNAGGTAYAGSEAIDEVAWYGGNSWFVGADHPDFGVHEVGQKKPNGLGLCDMSGNVCEWCHDRYGEDYYAASPERNPQGPDGGASRVNRGGGWSSSSQYCRVAFRDNAYPDVWGRNLGFRVVCAP